MEMFSIFLCLVLALTLVASQDEPVVMFRLQNIQSFWCGNMVETVVNEFLEQSERKLSDL